MNIPLNMKKNMIASKAPAGSVTMQDMKMLPTTRMFNATASQMQCRRWQRQKPVPERTSAMGPKRDSIRSTTTTQRLHRQPVSLTYVRNHSATRREK
jgi:hypothetical protein